VNLGLAPALSMPSTPQTRSSRRKVWLVLAVVFVAILAAPAGWYGWKRLHRAPPVQLIWTMSYAEGLKQAKAENKKVLLYFTGSDWCANCVLLDEGVLRRPAFARYAKDHYALVMLDFPIKKQLPDDIAAQNDALRMKYEVSGLPTLILLDPQGNELNKMVGYDKSPVGDFMTKLDADYPMGTMPASEKKVAVPEPGG